MSTWKSLWLITNVSSAVLMWLLGCYWGLFRHEYAQACFCLLLSMFCQKTADELLETK